MAALCARTRSIPNLYCLRHKNHPILIRRCHLILSNLRAPGGSGYVIPRGFLFDYVTCANYTAEIWSWVRGVLCVVW